MAGGKNPKQYLGDAALNPPSTQRADRDPTSSDLGYQLNTLWVNFDEQRTWQLVAITAGAAVWTLLGPGSTELDTLTGDSGGAISPVTGNIDILGDLTDGVSVVGTAGTLTINIAAATAVQRGTLETSTDAESVTGTSDAVAVTPASLTARLAAPGAIGGTTPAAGTFTDLTAVGTVSLNASGAGVSTIGTGGTGATNIGNATGNTAVTGSLTATTTLTATLGAITATNGNLVLGTAGNKLSVQAASNTATAGAHSFGTVTLIGGTITVSTTAVTANSIILLTRMSIGATGAAALGILSIGTVTASTSFVIRSLLTADATNLATTDVSVIGWQIIN